LEPERRNRFSWTVSKGGMGGHSQVRRDAKVGFSPFSAPEQCTQRYDGMKSSSSSASTAEKRCRQDAS
jgi:hypothetical protein